MLPGTLCLREATVKDRSSKIKSSIYELRAVIEDFRMQSVGGMEAAIDMNESCIVPLLIANCSTWLDIKKDTEDRLDGLKNLFGQVLLKIPHYIILNNGRLKSNSSIIPRSEGYTTQYTPKEVYGLIVNENNEVNICLLIVKMI